MKRNLFSKSAISIEQHKEIRESVRVIVADTWDEVKSSRTATPQSYYEEYLRESTAENKKK